MKDCQPKRTAAKIILRSWVFQIPVEKGEHHQKGVGQAELWMVVLFLLSLFPTSLNNHNFISQLQYLSPLSWIAMAVLLDGKFNKKKGFPTSQFSVFSPPTKISPLMPRQFSRASSFIEDSQSIWDSGRRNTLHIYLLQRHKRFFSQHTKDSFICDQPC